MILGNAKTRAALYHRLQLSEHYCTCVLKELVFSEINKLLTVVHESRTIS